MPPIIGTAMRCDGRSSGRRQVAARRAKSACRCACPLFKPGAGSGESRGRPLGRSPDPRADFDREPRLRRPDAPSRSGADRPLTRVRQARRGRFPDRGCVFRSNVITDSGGRGYLDDFFKLAVRGIRGDVRFS
jgi:hypothetical protein